MTGTRDRMVQSAARILTERGVSAVTVDGVLADSGAPRGSVYHHFPGGRDELALAGAQQAIAYIDEVLRSADTAEELIDAIATMYRKRLRSTQFRAGCPVMALASDARFEVAGARDAARSALNRWQDLLADALTQEGVREAAPLAGFLLSALEGALGLSRIHGTLQPLDDAHRWCLDLVRQRGTERSEVHTDPMTQE